MPVMVALGEDYPELREAVGKICERYPGAYWRKLEAEQAYPTEFITELTESGFLASLIPEEYGGSGLPLRAAAVILEQINASGCTASQGHAQMYIMGTLLRHGSEEQKQRYLPKIAPTRPSSRPGRCGRAINTSSMARRCGPRGRAIPT
jgi:acyl-CoA dehydrogenase